MRYKIRKGLFETNSSSMHAFVTCKDGEKLTPQEYQSLSESENGSDQPLFKLWLDDDGYLYLKEYYWARRPFKLCRSVYDKIRYCFGSFSHDESICQLSDDGVINNSQPEFQKLISVIQKFIPEFKGFKVEINKNEQKDYIYRWFDYCVAGDECISVHSDDLEDIIFNTKHIIVCDGDEYCDFMNMIYSQIIDDDKIEMIDGFSVEKYMGDNYCLLDD